MSGTERKGGGPRSNTRHATGCGALRKHRAVHLDDILYAWATDYAHNRKRISFSLLVEQLLMDVRRRDMAMRQAEAAAENEAKGQFVPKEDR